MHWGEKYFQLKNNNCWKCYLIKTKDSTASYYFFSNKWFLLSKNLCLLFLCIYKSFSKNTIGNILVCNLIYLSYIDKTKKYVKAALIKFDVSLNHNLQYMAILNCHRILIHDVAYLLINIVSNININKQITFMVIRVFVIWWKMVYVRTDMIRGTPPFENYVHPCITMYNKYVHY